MSNSSAHVFLIVPCFNEGKRWNEQYWAELSKSSNLSIIFIDDGSNDTTHDLLKNFCQSYKAKYLTMEKNCGKGEAIRQGWLTVVNENKARKEQNFIIGFVDADGAVSIEDILRLIKLFNNLNEYDTIWSSRVALSGRLINRKLTRHYLGRIFASIASMGIHSIPYDTQSGFKLFKFTSEFEKCIKSPFKTKWLFELEILNTWKNLNQRNIKIWEEPLNNWTDVKDSKVTIKEIFRIGIELIKIKLIHTN